MSSVLVKPRAVATWFPKTKKPRRKGLYRSSRAGLAPGYGGAYAYWDGSSWLAYKNWGDYTPYDDMIWSGSGVRCRTPIPVRMVTQV